VDVNHESPGLIRDEADRKSHPVTYTPKPGPGSCRSRTMAL
jgi:hypothetical protein